eukprot:3258763-Pyramimonas_sp.AAC.1
MTTCNIIRCNSLNNIRSQLRGGGPAVVYLREALAHECILSVHVTGRSVDTNVFGRGRQNMGLDVSPMCDRVTTKVSKTQLGFIDFVVLPLFNTFAVLMPWVEWNVLPILSSNKEIHK